MSVGGGPVENARTAVVGRLRARREELVTEIFARVRGDAFGPVGAQDAEYLAGLRAAVAAAVGYVLEGIERGEEWAGPIPTMASEQARRAARIGVSLDTVLRRYVVGHTLLEEFVMEEADRGEGNRPTPIPRDALRGVLRAQASALDRLLQAITGEYEDEAGRSRHGQSIGEGAVALPALLAHPSACRARECLRFITAHSDSSNREIATGIGIANQPQISRLLSQLAAEGLVSKRSQGAGKRNEWRLTPRGEQVLRMLSERRV
jgi:predicted transcriptional regulator